MGKTLRFPRGEDGGLNRFEGADLTPTNLSPPVGCGLRRKMRFFIWVVLLATGLVACGDELTRVQAIETTGGLPANENFRIRVLMVCPDGCIEVDPADAECSVDVDEDENRIELQPRVPVTDADSNCFDGGCQAGIPVLCPIPPLPAGTWQVQAGRVTESIELL